MGKFNLAVSYSGINADISKLKELKNKISMLLSEQEELIRKMPEIYGGTNGDEAFKRMSEHSRKWYRSYINELDNRIKFLEILIFLQIKLYYFFRYLIDFLFLYIFLLLNFYFCNF